MLIDVSMTIRTGSVFRLGTPAVQITSQGFHHESEGDYESIMLSMSAHTATHVDLVYPARRIEPERMIGPGTLIDVRQPPRKVIDLVDIASKVDIHEASFVLFRTGWSEFAGTARYHDHPELSPELVEWLISEKVGAVGIDAPGLGRGRRHGEYDRRLAAHGIFVIENLANLAAIPQSHFRVYCLPLKIANTDAIPARVLVEVEDSD
jgi:kynurenine formamidase